MRASRTRRWQLAIVGLVLVGAIGAILAEGLSSSLDYFLTVNQAVAQRGTLGSSTFRLEGTVVGSPRTLRDGVAFTMESSHVCQSVVNVGSPPELFQPNIPVVVVGHFAGGVFRSNQILVKHTASYAAAHPGRVKATAIPSGTCS